MIIAAHNMLTNGDFYRDPGANYYTPTSPPEPNPGQINQLESLGYRSLWNHSPNPPNPPPSQLTRCGHPISCQVCWSLCCGD